MTKSLFFISAIVISVFTIKAQSQLYTIEQNSADGLQIKFSTPTIDVKTKLEKGTAYSVLSIENTYPSSTVGAPQLPIISEMIEIPICENIIVNVISYTERTLTAAELGIEYEVYPTQPSRLKSEVGPFPFVKSNEIYSKNEFFSEPLARIEKVGVLRCINIATLYVSPVAYNPVTKEFKIYDNIVVNISYTNVDMPATYNMKNLHTNNLFKNTSLMVINPIPLQNRDEITNAPIKYLIVSHQMFRGYLDDFIAWKQRKGFLVEIAYTDQVEVGTTTLSIKNFIQSHYTNATPTNPAPTYCLIVGDIQQVPAFSFSGHVSDLTYYCWNAGDNIPDCYYGRFSAQTVDQLLPQIEKTLQVEQYTMPDPSYFGNAVLIAGDDATFGPTHAAGQMNYLSNTYINQNYGYNNVYYFTYPSGSQAAQIRSRLNTGVGYANYTAHGSSDGWAGPAFNTSHLSAMNNENKYGFFIGNCCVTSKFDESNCFAEAILRIDKKGAYGYIGGSNNTYWNEDYYWSVGVRNPITANTSYNSTSLGAYDKLFHTHNESYSNWFPSAGQMVFAGNISVQSSTTSASTKAYYWQIYCLMGDPSIMPYLSIPNELTLICPQVVISGTSELEVETEPYAYIALTHQNNLLAASFANETGIATLTTSEPLTPGEYEIAGSAQNHITKFMPLTVIVPSGPYVTPQVIAINDAYAPITGTSFKCDLKVKNLGVANATNVYAVLVSNDPNLTIITDSMFIGNVNVDQELILSSVFDVSIANYIPDLTQAQITVNIYFSTMSSFKNFNFNILSPKLTRNGYSIVEIHGNGNNIIDPDEIIQLNIIDMNAGHVEISNVQASLVSNYFDVVIENNNHYIPVMTPQIATNTSFTVHISANVTEGSIYKLYYRLIKDEYVVYDTLFLIIGKTMENFENNNFTTFPWINNNSYPWIITATAPYQGSYCARSAQNLQDNQSSIFQISMLVLSDGEVSFARKVSSELGYDFFRFYIDNVVKDELSGNVSWQNVSIPVLAGQHTFKFAYEKDYSVSNGSDCAWIDNVVFPIFGAIMPEDTVYSFPGNINNLDEQNIVIFPNPTNDNLKILSDKTIKTIAIYSLQGQLVKILSPNNTMAIINVNTMAKGIYLVKIETENKITIKKLLVN